MTWRVGESHYPRVYRKRSGKDTAWPDRTLDLHERRPDPTPERIRERCEIVQRSWTDEEERRHLERGGGTLTLAGVGGDQ